jgi:DNA repair exonuclease SbcCD ATPase subunit
MRKLKFIISFAILTILILNIIYGYTPYRTRLMIHRPFVKQVERIPIKISEDLRKLNAERAKVWFELSELLRQKPLDLNKIDEKAKELQKLEDEISKSIKSNILENLSQKLNLTDTQKNNIKKIFDDYFGKLEELRKELRRKTLELRTIDSQDKEKLSAKRKEIQDIQKKIDETRKNLLDEIKKLLTKEQKDKFEKFFKYVYPYNVKIFMPRVKIWIKR